MLLKIFSRLGFFGDSFSLDTDSFLRVLTNGYPFIERRGYTNASTRLFQLGPLNRNSECIGKKDKKSLRSMRSTAVMQNIPCRLLQGLQWFYTDGFTGVTIASPPSPEGVQFHVAVSES